MGCVPSKRVPSGVNEVKSLIVNDTGSLPTTPVLTSPVKAAQKTASAQELDGDALDRTAEPFQRTSTPRPVTGQTQSEDSGVHELYEEYADVITEFSDPEKVRAVELDFNPLKDIDLVVEGKQCPRRLSGKDRDRHEQEVILEKLRTEGLVLRPESKASGGVAFELVSASAASDTGGLRSQTRQLPPLLQKRKKTTKGSVEPDVTERSIRDKLKRAEDRRKKQEREKVKKTQVSKDKSTPLKPVEETKLLKQAVRMAATLESREKRLEDMVQKLKEKELHANAVRRRKFLLSDPHVSSTDVSY
ncbi:uncharacterized protein LOC121045875 [Ixodes scapularis]|uniref:uncharacterized protein LOC121045875 n=1 Tax=Ixodes scapularis TaxID=6945 RepID=UPI001AD6E6EE|nr:uncharacterized protein LOC121045875 [Ixodes scapularis]